MRGHFCNFRSLFLEVGLVRLTLNRNAFPVVPLKWLIPHMCHESRRTIWRKEGARRMGEGSEETLNDHKD